MRERRLKSLGLMMGSLGSFNEEVLLFYSEMIWTMDFVSDQRAGGEAASNIYLHITVIPLYNDVMLPRPQKDE